MRWGLRSLHNQPEGQVVGGALGQEVGGPQTQTLLDTGLPLEWVLFLRACNLQNTIDEPESIAQSKYLYVYPDHPIDSQPECALKDSVLQKTTNQLTTKKQIRML